VSLTVHRLLNGRPEESNTCPSIVLVPRFTPEEGSVSISGLRICAFAADGSKIKLTSAQEKSPDRLSAIDVDTRPAVLPPQVDAVLEARIEELRLERVGSTEGSYCLWITAHARLVRKLDGDLIYEQSVKFRSGRALFLDWTDAGALESVAQTGYRALADYFTSLIL